MKEALGFVGVLALIGIVELGAWIGMCEVLRRYRKARGLR